MTIFIYSKWAHLAAHLQWRYYWMLLIGSIDISKRMLDQIINLLESLGILNIDLHYSIAFDLQVSIG